MLGAAFMDQLVDLVLLFFIYSFFGWCMEVVLKYIQYHRFINRGFFSGPILPIYGSGAALITVAIENLSRVESAVGTTFAISFVLCGALEYFVSWFLEKMYHARWWDYSQKPMNLNGRVWIGNLILFGLGGVAIIHIANPLLYRLFDMVAQPTREIVAAACLIVFAADYVMTHFIMKLVKTGIESSEADNTEEVNREIHMLLSDKTVFHRRFAEAYPEVVYRTERINARMAEIKAETERLRREAERRRSEMNEKFEAGKQQLAASLEPSYSIRNTIIEKQDDLIRLLYEDATASDEARQLKKDIDAERERLNSRQLLSNLKQRAAEAQAR